ncbi:MAG TPA: TIGR04086 family membrane protein [Roseiflexaceae bacterium]|nr:TIGR04086 family membrane protein [Roseiflexaceae bacterium]
MNVRWMAVLTGFVVDYAISALLTLFVAPQFFAAPDPTSPGDLIMIALLTLSTGVGGFVAGRMAGSSRALNGLLVAIVGILLNQLGPPLPRVLVISSAIACGVAALGGYLSRFPDQQPSRSSRRQ